MDMQKKFKSIYSSPRIIARQILDKMLLPVNHFQMPAFSEDSAGPRENITCRGKQMTPLIISRECSAIPFSGRIISSYLETK